MEPLLQTRPRPSRDHPVARRVLRTLRAFFQAALPGLLLAGCVTYEEGSYVIRFHRPPAAASAEASERRDDPALDPVPREVTAALPQKLRLLKPGMTRPQVLQTLALTAYEKKIFSHAGGSPARAWEHLCLRRGHALVLTYDATRQPAGWVQAEYLGRGVTWVAR